MQCKFRDAINAGRQLGNYYARVIISNAIVHSRKFQESLIADSKRELDSNALMNPRR